MENNVVLTREEFMELVKLKTRIEVLADYLEEDKYISTNVLCAILGIEIKEIFKR